MPDPKDVNTKTLEEVHKGRLSDDKQATCDEIRRQVSPTIASWVETQFRLGNTRSQIWHKLEVLRNLVGTSVDLAPIDSAGVVLEDILGPPEDWEDDDVPTGHTTDGGG